ncbi:MAG: hypothetical protein GYA33_01390 [Thermogutta sp.]|nr:hypothetical protein [Thermogutta sp.]
MNRLLWLTVVASLAWAYLPCVSPAAGWKVGLARVEITPSEPTWMAGYAGRNRPAEGTAQPLWAKALAVSDPDGSTAVLVTADILGLTREVGDRVAAEVEAQKGIPRERIMLAASHTHSGPVVCGCADVCHPMGEKDLAAAMRYREEELIPKLAEVIVEALDKRVPARLWLGQSEAHFAENRRLPENGRIVMKPNLQGPVDPTVPVVVVKDDADRLMALLFGYACHNTTLDPAIYRYHGDYAGCAQAALEQEYPGITAMFIAGCGADANPRGRSAGIEVAERHGRELAQAVKSALTGELKELHPPLRVGFTRVDLELADRPSRETVAAWAESKELFRRRLGEHLLRIWDAQGMIPAASSCPIQVLRFGNDWALVGIGGEVVVDYALRLRKELAGTPHWVAGYCNEVFGYVPSERVLAEGGYEADYSQIYFGWHGPYKPGLEDKIVAAVKGLLAATAP